MSDTAGTALRLVGMVYDAALDEHKWPSFLEAFTRAVGGDSAMLRSVDLQIHKAGFVASFGYDPAWQSAYCNHFIKLDYFTPLMNQSPVGEIFSSDQNFCLTKQRKTEYFNDYSIPQDKVHALGTLLVKEGSHSLVFAAQRGKLGGAFGEEEMRLMEILAPHVTRAVHVHQTISTLGIEKKSALGVLDQLRMGVLLTSSFGTPLFVNRAAELILAQNQGIGIFHGRLVLSTATDTALLHTLIAGAAQGSHGAATGGDMRIPLPEGHKFLHCLVTPISPECSARWNISPGTDSVAIFLSKPGSLQLSPDKLAAMYKLTPAEAKLAARLAAFRSVEQAAEDLAIATLTARSQLRSVFAKTGAKGQAELLMLLATGTLANCCYV